ncbi:helix-turn-helix transcriptional regulator [Paenirhodobacter populi]|uniref:Helix-turn-helix domain-containing protein n=1 Tax=Paenirhodobacter populi TaxID=2306993 RepID=A0A443JUA9_9RHOB|nr:helix-turn-helix transcriptional regulator [Sinirhodobacter populi]RWR24088.1 helix-turn-helix domain-containing protein [Sinirhodobacter populi]
MARIALTGTRIRERRTILRIRQADLARSVGISPAYLNLIEHNRRRIGAPLLAQLAEALGTSAVALAEGAEAILFDGLRMAAAAGDPGGAPAELDRIEEFASLFPGWAGLLVNRQERVASLERMVETYADRLSHDPFLLDALHELLSGVTALRSTATILAETEDIEPEWQGRFLRTIGEEGERLSATAAALARHLDALVAAETGLSAPLDQVEAWLAACDWHLPEPDAPGARQIEARIEAAPQLAGTAARDLARRYARQAEADARALPLGDFLSAIARFGPEPARLAAEFGAPLGAVFRRLATLPPEAAAELPGGRITAGLVICDGSGTLTLRRPVPGFAPPRFGAACPLWPLYEALGRPMQPVQALIEVAGRMPRRFRAFAFCAPLPPASFDAPLLVESMMLVLPATGDDAARPVGTACRICPRANCPGRNEPALLPQPEPARGLAV